ncbi:MAG: alanine--glyoxylate aminotransferase family protein [Bdellovibrionales bacterium]|nr:alanine--glyoxylate aminotransferase family protein [Bdellovibrionales bacterium]
MSPIHLFTPGPTHIPERILKAMSIQELHHRTSQFRTVFQETAELLRSVTNAPTAPLFLSCSGSGAMEAVVANSVGRESTLGYLDAGKFGERWGDIAKAKSLNAIALKLEWGESPSIDAVRDFLTANPSITHFAMQYCETSTTVLHDVPAIAEMMRGEFPGVLVLIDAISAATTLEMPLDSMHWDAVVFASQKAFMLPPGFSMVHLSERFWAAAEKISPGTMYFDLTLERKSQAKGDAAWTPVTTLLLGLKEALTIFQEEGWKNVYQRHAACRERCFEWFEKLGIQPVNADHGSPSVTGGCFTDGKVDAEQLRGSLAKEYGFRIAGGQDHWKGKVLRFGHMGIIAPEDLDRCFAALQKLLLKAN